jgi:putative FmdB family regulatory protein
VALYEYACRSCGPFEVRRALGSAPGEEACPRCGAPAARVFGAPAIASPGSPLARAREAAERSAHEPAVVRGAPPPDRRVRRSANPLHANLPRP